MAAQLPPSRPEGLAGDGIGVLRLEEFATVWAVQKSTLAWLHGAGASASAGVPLASSIRDRLLFDRYAAEHHLVRQELDETDPRWVERIHAYFDAKHGMPAIGSAGDYSAAFDLCLPDPGARKALLRGLIEGVRPGFAQRAFGALVASGACNLAITTNFDRLIEQGFGEAQRAGTGMNLDLQRELSVAGIGSTERATVALQDRQWPLVVKLHGDFWEKRLMNTDTELQAQDATLRQFVVDVSRQFGLVINGYSGRDASVMAMLTDTVQVADAWPHGIWWLIRPGQSLTHTMRDFLRQAAQREVSANVVVSASFDETMSALSRQVVVDEHMREYLNHLHPKPRATPAAIPVHTRQWPVLRFNALPIVSSNLDATRVVIPSGWTRRDVRRAMHPRSDWPVVVNGPGEMICLGDPQAALSALESAATERDLPQPGPASAVQLDLLAEDAPLHHQTVLLQALAHALAAVLPVWVRTDRSGAPDLIVTTPRSGEPPAFRAMRSRLNRAYQDDMFGQLPKMYGLTSRGQVRRWAEKLELSLERRAETPWLLFRPWTYLDPLPRTDDESGAQGADERGREEHDPASPWRAERWAKQRFNENWAAIIVGWTGLLAPETTTTLSVPSPAGEEPAGSIVLGRTNAYSRPA